MFVCPATSRSTLSLCNLDSFPLPTLTYVSERERDTKTRGKEKGREKGQREKERERERKTERESGANTHPPYNHRFTQVCVCQCVVHVVCVRVRVFMRKRKSGTNNHSPYTPRCIFFGPFSVC